MAANIWNSSVVANEELLPWIPQLPSVLPVSPVVHLFCWWPLSLVFFKSRIYKVNSVGLSWVVSDWLLLWQYPLLNIFTRGCRCWLMVSLLQREKAHKQLDHSHPPSMCESEDSNLCLSLCLTSLRYQKVEKTSLWCSLPRPNEHSVETVYAILTTYIDSPISHLYLR